MAGPKITVEDYSKCTLLTPRWWGGEVLRGSQLIVAGGHVPDATAVSHEKSTTTVEIVDLVTCKHQFLSPQLKDAHLGSQPQVLRNGQAVFFGGMDTGLIEIMTDRLSEPAGHLLSQRSAAASAELADGRVLITGGYHNVPGKPIERLKTVEIYDPKLFASEPAASMIVARASHSLTPLGNGRYLLAGGAKEAAQTAEIYDEKTGKFTALQSGLKFGRKDHRAVADGHGRIWFIGGTDASGHSQEAIEYYDVRKAKFVPTKMKLSEGREDLAAVYIPELNCIVAVGGEHKGIVDGRKDPPSAAIDVLDLNKMQVTSAHLASPRDEATLETIAVDRKAHAATLLTLQGVTEEGNGQKRVPSPEKITIQLR